MGQQAHNSASGQPAPFDPAYPGRGHEPGDGTWDEDSWEMPLPGERAALDALRFNWAEAYEIGCDEGLWWYRRRDRKGGRETAATPEDLRNQIVTDYTCYPVDQAARLPSPDQPPPDDPAAASDCEAKAVQWT